MKFFTKNLLRFTLAIILFTILYRLALSYSLSVKSIPFVIIFSILYGIIMFSLGWFFGKRDHLDLPIYDIGFRFHLITYLVCNIIGELWYVFDFNSAFEKISYVHITAVIWGFFLIIHFIIYLFVRKKSVLGLNKSELFD